MKRYVFFDKKTGQILHTHQVYKLGSEELQEVSEEELKRMVGRIVDPARAESLLVDIPVQSSFKAELSVNPKTRKLVVTKLPPKLQAKKEIKDKTPPGDVGKGGE
jgi:hypothetical protein